MKKVEIYSTPTCTYCRMAKDLFKANNIAYTEYNVATDLEKRNEMFEKSGHNPQVEEPNKEFRLIREFMSK